MVLTKTEFDSINILHSDRSIFTKKALKTDVEPCFIIDTGSEFITSYLRVVENGVLRIEEGRGVTELDASIVAETKMMRRKYRC